MTISLCMIVKDEEAVIGRLLKQAVKFADEIIVVDTGSKDKTIEIAKSYTDKVYPFKWVGDFSKARNYAFSFAKSDYIMWLDADDYVMDEDVEKILSLKKSNMQADIYMFEYVLTYEKDYTPIFKYLRERLFKRSKNFKWVDPVHEVVVLSGDIENRDIKIYHMKEKPNLPGRNLKIYRKLKREKVKFSPRQKFYYARELMFNGYYTEALREFNSFLKEPEGWVENKIQACIDKSFCYKNLNQPDKELTSLLLALQYSEPRSEVSYRLGNWFLKNKKLDEAEFWFLCALEHSQIVENGAFIERDMHDFLPALQLCYLYFLKNDIQKSFHFHEISKTLRPNDSSVQNNEKYFINHFEKMLK